VIKTAGRLRAALQDLGAAVALFEAGPVLIPAADASVSAEFSRAFRGQGVDVLTGTMVEALRRDGAGIQVDYRSGEQRGQLEAGAVFFAVGWPANLDALNLDVAGVATEPGWIPVDDYLRTNVGHIFAAGDVNGRSMLVQSARMEGRLAATNAILGPSRQASYDVVPSGSFTGPEYGRVGLTEGRGRAAARRGRRHCLLQRPAPAGRGRAVRRVLQADRGPPGAHHPGRPRAR
jgi:pyruvate/2-oxoglutarate dehydrogenase complex dihydrolipoamide dehydrogenase (E3) component